MGNPALPLVLRRLSCLPLPPTQDFTSESPAQSAASFPAGQKVRILLLKKLNKRPKDKTTSFALPLPSRRLPPSDPPLRGLVTLCSLPHSPTLVPTAPDHGRVTNVQSVLTRPPPPATHLGPLRFAPSPNRPRPQRPGPRPSLLTRPSLPGRGHPRPRLQSPYMEPSLCLPASPEGRTADVNVVTSVTPPLSHLTATFNSISKT